MNFEVDFFPSLSQLFHHWSTILTVEKTDLTMHGLGRDFNLYFTIIHRFLYFDNLVGRDRNEHFLFVLSL